MAAKDSPTRTTSLGSDLDTLRSSILDTLNMLERVHTYVDNARSDSSKANVAVGRFLMDALSVRPSLDPEVIEKMFNSHLQDVLMVSYLARTVREQLQISNQLQILSQ
jgi:translation initiation factor 3 subunit F